MRYRVNEPDALAEVFEEEVLVINLGSGDYHSLRGAGVVIWRLLAAGHDADDAATWLASHWGIPRSEAADAVATLADQLVERLMLLPSAPSDPVVTAVPAWLAQTPAVFEAVKLETYADMQELLLIDPIHEVDVTGWPNRPDETKQG